MARLWTAVIAVCAALVAVVRSEMNFIVPPPYEEVGTDYRENPTYDVGDWMTVQWENNNNSVYLLLWQEYPEGPDGSAYTIVLEDTDDTSYRWNVNLYDEFIQDVPEDDQLVFYFEIADSEDGNNHALSRYFNITIPRDEEEEDVVSTSMSSTSLPTDTPTSSPIETPEPSEDGGDELSTGAVAGIAVGATLGGILVLAVGGFFLWKRSKKGRSPSNEPQELDPTAAMVGPQDSAHDYGYGYGHGQGQMYSDQGDYYKPYSQSPANEPVELSSEYSSQPRGASRASGWHEAP